MALQSHVWRWKDEDPLTIVPLVIITASLLLVPWEGCHPLKSDQDQRQAEYDAQIEAQQAQQFPPAAPSDKGAPEPAKAP